MALQTSISHYFNSRKRGAADATKQVNSDVKVLILEKNVADSSDVGSGAEKRQTIKVFTDKTPTRKTSQNEPKSGSAPQRLRKTLRAKRKSKDVKEPGQLDIRKSLLPSFEAPQEQPVNVPFIVKGLSPKKKSPNLAQIKEKLGKSSRLDSLKAALTRFNKGADKLKEIQEKKEQLLKSPILSKFESIDIEVPSSPIKSLSSPRKSPSKTLLSQARTMTSPSSLRKALFMSPPKSLGTRPVYVSPRKLFDSPPTSPVKSHTPTYEQYLSLVNSGKPTLVLPYKYRCLAETFRAVDTIVSIMYNRGEVIIFDKLKLSVQQMNKRNIYESHLGQILTVMPTAYELSREKVRQMCSQTEKYEMVIRPILPEPKETDQTGKRDMTPLLLLERRRSFYNRLVELVKDVHHDFLLSLTPPLKVPKEKLTRWHPEFDIESVPEVKPSPLPEIPNHESCSTAKEVLGKAKAMFGANNRMTKALERISDSPSASKTAPKPLDPVPGLTRALRGIPAAVLEKVRARQAAKTVALLTRDPIETKRRLQFTRLPELARILRNIYVTERKNVLARPLVTHKMIDSYRESMTEIEMSEHIDLIITSVPGWITVVKDGNREYLKLVRDADFKRILTKLNSLVSENQLDD